MATTTSNRFVLDTNVVISAALTAAGKPAAVLRSVLDTGVLVFSNETFEELATRLSLNKFDRYVTTALRRQLLVELAAVAEWTTITGALRAWRDPQHDMFVETALAGQASLVVTGDKDLLALHLYRDLSIISPENFLVGLD